MLDFVEIKEKDIDQFIFQQAIQIYTNSFHEYLRLPLSTMAQRIREDIHQLWVGVSQQKVVSIALLHPLNQNFLFLEYLAVEESCRNQGIGKLSLNKVVDICKQSNKHLIFEVTSPDFKIESEREKIIKTLSFYNKLGAKEMKDVRYIMPPLQLDIPENQKLMIMEYPENQMSGKLVESLIRQFYKDVYSRSEDDSFLNSFIHDIPPLVELI